LIGSKLSQYQILELLASGGMGHVYRAWDERLERDVAVKVLPLGSLGDDVARRQFRKEALSLSRLNHPNIATVHDFNTQDGIDFIVLELVPGQTLAERISSGPLAEQEVARLGEQLADGLEAAHRQGVLHRDIKPSNIKITPEGRLKILDFGLARLTRRQQDPTRTETVSGLGPAGTLPYMAPEQVQGATLDARSDIHAAGAVLYEMAYGRRAFPQESPPAVIAAILGNAPTIPKDIASRSSKNLQEVILRCLQKDPRHRYASAHELADDLRQLALPLAGRRVWPGRGRRALVASAAGGMALLLAAGALLFAFNVGGFRTDVLGRSTTGERSLAVLPLINLSGDPGQDYFADGLTEELITRLAQVAALRVISRSSIMQYKGTRKTVGQIAKELNVGFILEGSAARSGDHVRVSATLIDPKKDRHLWAESYQRGLKDVLVLQSDLVRSIVDKVQVQLTPNERTRLEVASPVDPGAHQAFLKGRLYVGQFSKEALERARQEFEISIERDPTFAPAYAGLGEVYLQLSGNFLPTTEAIPRARAALLRSIELDSQYAPAYATLAVVQVIQDWNWQEAESTIVRAVRLAPGDAVGHQNYGQLLVALGRFDEAERELERAREIDPLSEVLAYMSIWPLFEGRRYDRAIAAATQIVELDPNVSIPHLLLGQALLFGGDGPRAIAEIRRSAEIDTGFVTSLAWLGYAYARTGDRAKAIEMRNLLTARSHQTYVQPYFFALLDIGLGDREAALGWVEQAAEAGSDELFFIKVDPAMDPLRPDPRFKRVLARFGFQA
jgi:TolB-like protein/tetratricopeptide (TPR) repeat protein